MKKVISQLHFVVVMITDTHTGITRLTIGNTSLKENCNALYKHMRVLAIHLNNPLTNPPDEFQNILVQIKRDMKANPN